MLPRPILKRKQGGQPGNLNAYKHGFYSRRFTRLEIKDLATILPDNFDDDIAVVRVCMRRMFNLADKDAKTLDEWATVNFAIGSNATRIGGLKRVQYLISGGNNDDLDNLVIKCSGMIAHEMGFK